VPKIYIKKIFKKFPIFLFFKYFGGVKNFNLLLNHFMTRVYAQKLPCTFQGDSREFFLEK
jgi:hypothetical protein